MLMIEQASQITRDELSLIETPRTTKTWAPQPHVEVVDQVHRFLDEFKVGIKKETFSVAANGSQMYGSIILDLSEYQTEGPKRIDMSLGIRNSHNKKFSLGYLFGGNVLVCDNGFFTGETKSLRKHTSGLDLPRMTRDFIFNCIRNMAKIDQAMKRLESRELGIHEADSWILNAMREGVVPGQLIPKVVAEYDNPQHNEFKGRNAWSLYNSFTEVVKERSPQGQVDTLGKLPPPLIYRC